MVAGGVNEDKLLTALKDLETVLDSHEFQYKIVYTYSKFIKNYFFKGTSYNETSWQLSFIILGTLKMTHSVILYL